MRSLINVACNCIKTKYIELIIDYYLLKLPTPQMGFVHLNLANIGSEYEEDNYNACICFIFVFSLWKYTD